MDGAERHGSGGKAAGEREAGPLDPPGVAARVAGWLDRDPALPPPGPLTLEIYPTLRCNLDCAFCDTTDRHRPPVGEPSDARWLEVIDEAAALGVRRVLVLGGTQQQGRTDQDGSFQEVLGAGTWRFKHSAEKSGYSCANTVDFEVEGGNTTWICIDANCQ